MFPPDRTQDEHGLNKQPSGNHQRGHGTPTRINSAPAPDT
jgi:hypothetical protein